MTINLYNMNGQFIYYQLFKNCNKNLTLQLYIDYILSSKSAKILTLIVTLSLNVVTSCFSSGVISVSPRLGQQFVIYWYKKY